MDEPVRVVLTLVEQDHKENTSATVQAWRAITTDIVEASSLVAH